MPALSIWGSFRTVRSVGGALVGNQYVGGGTVPYDLTGEMHEEFPTDGSPRTFTVIARVKSDRAEQFKEAVLPDVKLLPAGGSDQHIDIGTIGTGSDPTKSNQIWTRQQMVRFYPEPHPIYPNAWLRHLSLLRGEGYPVKNPNTHWIDFATWDAVREQQDLGFTLFALTFQDLQMQFVNKNFITRPEDNGLRGIPDQNADNAEINQEGHSEIERWTLVQPDPRGNNLQIKENRQFFFVEDDGTPSRVVPGDPTSTILNIPNEAAVIYLPLTAFTITWYMVPRVPLSLVNLQSHVNATSNDIALPFEVFPNVWPDVGCFLYFNYHLSKPYFTYSDQRVYDLTMSCSHRFNGINGRNRGWNSTWNPKRRDFQRFVAGVLSGTTLTDPSPLPITGGTDAQAVVPASLNMDGTITRRNLMEFAYLSNLWKFEGIKVGG